MSESADFLRFFPYDEPFDGQREAMERIHEALGEGQDVCFEGACGTGKTLAALAPALEYARAEGKTVVITTNVHQQQRQFVREARRITAREPIRAVVFRGKGSMCHVDVDYEECQVLRDATREQAELEQEREELRRRLDALRDEARRGAGGGGTADGGGASDSSDGAADERVDAAASEAFAAVRDELEAVEAQLEDVAEQATCEHYYENLAGDASEFYDWLYDDVRTPDEIYERAGRAGFCGYELLKEGVDDVDLAICNYHHLLDPTIREAFLRWLDCEPEDAVVVFDEAHNVADAAREHATRTCSERTVERALDELEATPDPRREAAANVLEPFLAALRETYEDGLGFGEVSEAGWTDVTIENEDRRDELTLSFLQSYAGSGVESDLDDALALGRELDQEYEQAYRDGDADRRQDCETLQAAAFLQRWLDDAPEPEYYPVVSVTRDGGTDEVYGRAELVACLPDSVTGSLVDGTHATVFMSATLRPFEVLTDVLGLSEPATMTSGLSFPAEHRRTVAVGTPPLFSSDRDDPEVQAAVAEALADAIRFTPGNTLAFFPSYAEAERYHDLLTGARKLPGDAALAGRDGRGSGGSGGGSGHGSSDASDGSGAGSDARDGSGTGSTGASAFHDAPLGGDVTTYLDQPATRAEDMRQRFVDDDRGALFTSLWGTLAEGVSFDGDDAHTVAVVGVPYPHLDDRTTAVRDAYDLAFADRDVDDPGWTYAVEIPTVRKTRQAIGRVVRSPEDVGVRALLDARYTAAGAGELGQYSVYGTLPGELREELIDVQPGKLRYAMLNFYREHDAFDGAPPAP